MTIQKDEHIDYNDEIVSIEYVGEMETMDITVSDDNLFYANNILTKNSMGGPMTFDFLIALIVNEDLTNVGQAMIKQLKNRYGDLFKNNKFTVGVDRAKMKFYDLNNSSMVSQIANSTPTPLTSAPSKTKSNLNGLKV